MACYAAMKVNADLSSAVMQDVFQDLPQNLPQDPPQVLAQTRLDNSLALFEEFVRATARHADAATLRGLERRFAERVQIQPSYWSQIKGRSRQIGERLARQFELLCHKPHGWMDVAHGAAGPVLQADRVSDTAGRGVADESAPCDDDERFIVGLVLTYYRRHPQRARTRLLDLLGEVLDPLPAPSPAATQPGALRAFQAPQTSQATQAPPVALTDAQALGQMVAVAPGVMRPVKHAAAPLAPQAEDAHSLWLQSQTGVAPLKRKK